MDLHCTSEPGRWSAASDVGSPATTPRLRQPDDTKPDRSRDTASSARLVLSVAETAEALGISDDLVYELMHRGQLPCLHFGRRKVVPRRAIDLVIRAAMSGFDPAALLVTLSARGAEQD